MIAGLQNLWNEQAVTGGPDDQTATIEPYLVDTRTPKGCVVVCPGGGYQNLAPHEAEPVAKLFNAAGLHACILRYRRAPHPYPVPLTDGIRAIRYVRAHAKQWRIDPERIAMLGFSAGGHLVSTVSTQFGRKFYSPADAIDAESARPDAAILCYPVISLLPPYAHEGSRTNLLGDADTPALRRRLSNEKQITAATPPTFLWHTADDAAVPVQNSLAYAKALQEHGVPFEMHIYPHGTHGLGLAEKDTHVGSWTSSCLSWLRSLGY
ncbi:MAG TPA: alpha/beta hydrolase [Spirochaetia bacterium]|nr:alpha/beta hydrolase [Spirochaetia bacterium]